MMVQEDQFNYAEDDSMQVVEMDYKGGNVSMIIFLPTSNDLSQVEKQLSADSYNKWRSQLK